MVIVDVRLSINDDTEMVVAHTDNTHNDLYCIL